MTKLKKEKIIIKIKEKIKRKIKTIATIILSFLVIFGIYWWENNKKIHTTEGVAFEYTEKMKMQDELVKMVKGYPIEKMIPFIIEQDPIVAAFLVAIAKKESAWGKRVPLLNNEDCFNYWGYRGGGDRVTQSGYTCFDSPQQAIEIVGGRIKRLAKEQGLDTPQKMIVWKCGSTCAGHSEYGVNKWITDVGLYFKKLTTILVKN